MKKLFFAVVLSFLLVGVAVAEECPKALGDLCHLGEPISDEEAREIRGEPMKAPQKRETILEFTGRRMQLAVPPAQINSIPRR